MPRFPRIGSLLLVLTLALSTGTSVLAHSPAPSWVASPAPVTSGIKIADMDRSADPGEDFYRFANGAWLDHAVIPDAYVSYGAMDELYDLNKERQLDQLDKLMQSNTLQPGSDQWKAVEFYKQGIDQAKRNADGISPLQPQLDAIASVTDLKSLHTFFVSDASNGVPDFFNIGVGADLADSSVNTAWVGGPLLGLGDPDYYTEDSESNIAAREAYKTAAAEFFQLTGMSKAEATAAAQAVYDFEATLAADMLTSIDWQDPANFYHPTTLDEMQTRYPALDWQAYMTFFGATVDGQSIVVNAQQELFANLANILAATDIETIKDYLTLQVMLGASSLLDEQAEAIGFRLSQAIYGVEDQLPIEEEVLMSVNGLMRDAMGQLYVADYFPPEAKTQIEALVDNLIAAFRIRLENNPWMSDATRAAAIAKLDAIRVKVGYPDQWKTYENYTIGDSYYATVNDSLNAEGRALMAKYGQPVDRDLWWLGAQDVDAGYDPSNNDIMFPAGILQPPFYDPAADPASNYGAIGVVIGHELTHGFDITGSQFDQDGNFADWWTDADRTAFEALNDEVVAQYSKIEVLPQLFVDGQLTVGENVADMGGMQIAMDALEIALQQAGDPGDIDGFTQSQRFFIALAQLWRGIYRDEFLQTFMQTNPHAPGPVRAVTPSQNMDEFYAAFPEVEPGESGYIAPEDRVVIW